MRVPGRRKCLASYFGGGCLSDGPQLGPDFFDRSRSPFHHHECCRWCADRTSSTWSRTRWPISVLDHYGAAEGCGAESFPEETCGARAFLSTGVWSFVESSCGTPWLLAAVGQTVFQRKPVGQTVFQRKLVGLARACSPQLPYNYQWILRRPLIKSLGSCRAPHNYPTTT